MKIRLPKEPWWNCVRDWRETRGICKYDSMSEDMTKAMKDEIYEQWGVRSVDFPSGESGFTAEIDSEEHATLFLLRWS